MATQKVLKYKADGNTLMDKKMDLEQINDVVYCRKWSETNRWGEVEEYVDLVFKIGNTFCEPEMLHKNTFERNKSDIEAYTADDIIGWLYSGFPNSMKIEVATREGLDVERLQAERQRIISEREAKRAAEKQAELDKGRERAKAWLAKIHKSSEDFVKGERIDKEYFVELCKMNNVELHIRTIGMLNKLKKCEISVDNGINYVGPKTTNFEKVFAAAHQLKEILA